MKCEKCGKDLNVEKEGNRLCLSCQTDYVSDKWKTNKQEIYDVQNETES